MGKVYAFDHEGEAGCCNEEVSTLYVAADSHKEAAKLLKDGMAGCCGRCFSELLADGSWDVFAPPAVEEPAKCKRCGSSLTKLLGRCMDVTCPYNSRKQDETWTEG